MAEVLNNSENTAPIEAIKDADRDMTVEAALETVDTPQERTEAGQLGSDIKDLYKKFSDTIINTNTMESIQKNFYSLGSLNINGVKVPITVKSDRVGKGSSKDRLYVTASDPSDTNNARKISVIKSYDYKNPDNGTSVIKFTGENGKEYYYDKSNNKIVAFVTQEDRDAEARGEEPNNKPSKDDINFFKISLKAILETASDTIK